MLDEIHIPKVYPFLYLLNACNVSASLLGIGNIARYKQKCLCLPKLTFQQRKQMVNKQIYKQIYKVKHTIYQIVSCAMEENKTEQEPREFLERYLNEVVREGSIEKVVFFLKPCGQALLAEIIALCALLTKMAKYLLLTSI